MVRLGDVLRGGFVAPGDEIRETGSFVDSVSVDAEQQMTTPDSFLAAIDRLHDEAAQATGLSDFGDPRYLEALRMLLRGYDEQARLGPEGRAATWQALRDQLASRLRSNARFVLHADALRRPIERPIVITGMSRTGTTALHKLLAADPDSQCLEYWLGCDPDVRPPRETWPSHPGHLAACEALRRIYAHAPEIEKIHSMQPDEADECRLLFLQDFLGFTYSMNATLPAYEDWLLGQDMRAPYLRYRDNLKLIGAATPEKRWVLKNSSHLWALEDLFAALPGACVVHTHRHPAELIPSISSLVHRMRSIYEPGAPKDVVGRQMMDLWARVLEMNMASRAATGAHVFDLHFETFNADPIGSLRAIYAFFDLPWTARAERDVRAWADENRRGQHGEHRYSAEEYGLSEAEIETRFAGYVEWQAKIRDAF